jgi:carbonic anhydrase/acetyltransferase-like protein (isoleucine patch superfamily)
VPVYALGDKVPEIHESAYVHPDAVVIGSVHIGAEASIWPGAVLRGDDGDIFIGARTSIQDGCVLHCTETWPTVVGDEVVVGHIVHLEGCTIEDRALVGNGSVVLHRAVVRTNALVGSNAVVPADMEVPSGAMALGVPARIRPDCVHPDMIHWAMQSYVDRAAYYRQNLRVIPTRGV